MIVPKLIDHLNSIWMYAIYVQVHKTMSKNFAIKNSMRIVAGIENESSVITRVKLLLYLDSLISYGVSQDRERSGA
jgi:hypothetical protein